MLPSVEASPPTNRKEEIFLSAEQENTQMPHKRAGENPGI